MRPFSFFAVVAFVALFTTADSSVIKTEYGSIEGKVNGSVHEFLGVPFASPPIGDLRWKAPVAPLGWVDTLKAVSFKDRCIQKDFGASDDTAAKVIGSEDCLYLNVWTPSVDSVANLPVMVFIHGGGNQQGSASDSGLGTAIYHGKNLSQRGNVVVVTIQYRLGVMGFLVHKGLEGGDGRALSGNYGVLDQIMALKWVKKNIRQFGGDTARIMVFGESAGGLNTGNLMISPAAKGLFSRACIESAIPQVANYDSALVKSKSFVDSLLPGVPNEEQIGILRTMSADSIVKMEKDNVVGGVIQGNWKPVVDGAI
ncbi:MAG: carboxylesterase family protein, partial [Fibrobacteres bacterium]|nr:carboxylesterase family protein [Fibrobacterota bacterium]